jgi:hypothetical protein
MDDIRFYCGVGEKHYNHHPVYTGRYACVSPVCGSGKRPQKKNSIAVPADCQEVILDSGAFSDTTYHRCSFEEALTRQLSHASEFNYAEKLSHLASYDVLIDEQDRDGVRVKERWGEDLAGFAVKQTVLAAQFLDSKRAFIRQCVGHDVGLVLSAQGVTAEQYLHCAEQVLPLLNPETDIFGLGGWCILGRQRPLLPVFYETVAELVPLLKRYKVRRAHIWGVCFAEPLGDLLFLCDHTQRSDGLWGWDEGRRIQLSTDSVGPTTRITREEDGHPGHTYWGYASWRKLIPLPRVHEECKAKDEDGNKSPICQPGDGCRGLMRAQHVRETVDWFSHFREREAHLYRYVKPEKTLYQQMSLFGEEAV